MIAKRGWGAALAILALAACAPSAADAPIAEQWRAVAVEATPVTLGVGRAGALVVRGGVELRSTDPVFGGLSGLEVLDDGRFVAISDNGDWFEGRLVLSEDGALTGVADVRTAMMRDEAGQPFPNKEAGDSEDLAQLSDGRFAVSFEQTQTIRIYDLNRDGPFGAAVAGPRLEGVERLPRNVGLEAITATGYNTLLVGAEGGSSDRTPLWLAALDAHAPVPPLADYPLARGFALTSLDRLPEGGFVALERFYAPVIGARARISRFADAAINQHGGDIDKQELAVLTPPMPVDNFEGISAVRMPSGVTRIYIVSDNNFSRRQRTLLYAFDMVEGGG
jgi:hypothetical protein